MGYHNQGIPSDLYQIRVSVATIIDGVVFTLFEGFDFIEASRAGGGVLAAHGFV